jgi:outer membrane protein
MKAKQWLVILALGLASIQVQASLKIAVVDIRTALFTSNAAKDFSKGLVDKFKKQELEVKSVQQEGLKLQAKLKKDSAIMSAKEKDDLTSKLGDKIKEFKYLKDKLDEAVNKSKQQFIQDAKPKMDRILKSIIDKEKLDLVLPRQATIYSQPSMDITAKVIEMLNKK